MGEDGLAIGFTLRCVRQQFTYGFQTIPNPRQMGHEMTLEYETEPVGRSDNCELRNKVCFLAESCPESAGCSKDVASCSAGVAFRALLTV